jgi:hypothetical protein
LSTGTRRASAIIVVCCITVQVNAQQSAPSAPQRLSPVDVAKFLAGAALGLTVHESGHLTLDVAFGASPGVRKVSAGFIPFFAITHEQVTPVREFAISSAGFWVQHASSEWLLVRRPDLRHEHAPYAKGLLAFNVLTSVMYAGAAFARRGPLERDTRGMALSANVSEPWIGVSILTPAVLVGARYFQPHSPWMRWTSRASKVAGALMILKAPR